MMLFSETETAKQNQKFPFHFFFRFAVEGWGEETREKCKEIFWFLHTRVRERVRGALYRFTTQSGRTERFRATTRSARAISRNQDLTQNTFELCPINTAVLKFNKNFAVMQNGRLAELANSWLGHKLWLYLSRLILLNYCCKLKLNMGD